MKRSGSCQAAEWLPLSSSLTDPRWCRWTPRDQRPRDGALALRRGASIRESSHDSPFPSLTGFDWVTRRSLIGLVEPRVVDYLLPSEVPMVVADERAHVDPGVDL